MQVEQVSASDVGSLVARHRAYFLSGKTRPIEWREAQLTALAAMITENAKDFHAALWTDLRRNWIEADLVDVAGKDRHGRRREESHASGA